MLSDFIDKVEQVVLSNLEKEGFGVGDLAGELGFSRSQVLRKVKASTGKSVYIVIREIRLREAAKLIQEGEYTASEIAYKVGFSSPSYFNKCFHDNYDCTPGDYRKTIRDADNTPAIEAKKESSRKSGRLRIILLIAAVLGPIVILLLVFRDSIFQDRDTPALTASIAVLPFLNLSEESDQEYVADGITEGITLELSHHSSIRVISRTSAMRYKGEKVLSSDIATELGVDYLLEGSVMHSADSLRVVVQLIEPFPNEKHLWADSYDQKYVDLLQLVKRISNQIATEVNLAVMPAAATSAVPQVDPEAFDLYLRARHLWNQQNTSSVKRAVEYLLQSISIDSAFAPAYVTLAEAYITLNKLIRDNEEKLRHRELSRAAIAKALELDPELGSAYITRGNIAGRFDWDWETMRTMANKGLSLDPNNAYGYILLSNYYLVRGKFERALEMALFSEKLDPLNPMTGCLVAERYYLIGDYERSIAQYKHVLELYPTYGFAWDGIGYAQFMSGKREEAMQSWRQLHLIMGNQSSADIYATETIDVALHYWLEKAKGETPQYCSNPTIIAMAHIFVDDPVGALEYLDIAYKYRNEDLPTMMLRPHWKSIYSESRFQELAQKMNVAISF